MIKQSKAVEQLWYTWSDVGLDTIRAGFRIRAASEGLKDIHSARVQNLDRYQRYSLPRDVNPAIINPSMAPICLSLITTGQERILVHKAYTGKDAVGRYGTFFVHLLTDLPEEFSALHAISLWRSSFWQISDITLKDRRSTSLDRLPPEHLWEIQKSTHLNCQNTAKAQKYLQYIIQAYLTKKPLLEKKTGQLVPQKIYIAASDDDIAQLIFGLTCCLPPQLLKNLTFSTYEQDITQATTEIIGTCWLSLSEAEKDPHVEHLLPAQYYQEKLAINCYTGTRSPLENNPLVENKPLADQFAQHAMENFMQGGTEQFAELLDAARGISHLDVDKFLELYDTLILRAQNPSKQDIESILTPRSDFDYKFSAKKLSEPIHPRALIDLAIRDPKWWQTFGKAAVTNLRKSNAKVPTLAQTLSEIAQLGISRAVAIVNGEDPLSESATSGEVRLDEEAILKIIVDMLYCAAPPEAEPAVWNSLLHELLAIKHVISFLNKYWDIYANLMKIWSATLPPSQENNTLICPLLSQSWITFGDFLALRLPLDWTEIATRTLISQPVSGLTEESAYHLEQKYHPFLADFLQHLAQDSQRWPTAKALFEKLAEAKYPTKVHLLSILLDSPMGQHKDNGIQLLERTHLTANEQALFLEHYGPQYLPPPDKAHIVLEMFSTLASNDVHKEKMRVLFGWLESPLLSTWLCSPPNGLRNLVKVLKAANLNGQESGEFFQRYGQKYITLYPQSPTLLELFAKHARLGSAQRIYFLSIWLNLHLKQKLLEQLLETACLTTVSERREFLERYGEKYLLLYPQSQILLKDVKEFLAYLPTINIDVFKEGSPSGEPSATERFLQFLSTFLSKRPSQQLLVYDWYNVGIFIGQPAILQREQNTVVQSIGRVLRIQNILPETRTKIIRELAVACIEARNDMVSVIATMHNKFTIQDIFLIFQDIAVTARYGVFQKQYEKNIFLVCILSVFKFKSIFTIQNEQDRFVQSFLTTLLQDIDGKTAKWLNTEAKKWTPEDYAEWQKYKPPSAGTEPSLFEQMQIALKSIIMKIALVSGKALPFGWGDRPSGRKNPLTQQRALWSLITLVAIVIVTTFVGLDFWINSTIIIPNQPIISINDQHIRQFDHHRLIVFKTQQVLNILSGPHGLIARQAIWSTKVTSDQARIGSLNAQLSSTADPDKKAGIRQQINADQKLYDSDNTQLTTLQSNITAAQASNTQSQIANESVNWLQDDLIIRQWVVALQSSAIQAKIEPSASQIDSAMNQFIKEMPKGSTYNQFLSKYSVSNDDMRAMMALKLRRDNMNNYQRTFITSPTRQIKAQVITLSTMEDTQDALKQLNQGADFAMLAKNKFVDTMTQSKGGELGWLVRWQYTVNNSSNKRGSGAIDNWLFDPARKVNELSPVLTENGTYHIVQIEGINPSRNVDDPHTLDTLRANDTPLLAWLNSQEVDAHMTPGNSSMEFNPTNMPQDIPTSPPPNPPHSDTNHPLR